MRPKVYVPQEPAKFDHNAGAMVRSMDLSPAMEYGDLVVCLPPNALFINMAPNRAALREAMRDFRAGDYLLCVGSIVIISVAVIIANELSGRDFYELQWDKRFRKYQPVHFKNV